MLCQEYKDRKDESFLLKCLCWKGPDPCWSGEDLLLGFPLGFIKAADIPWRKPLSRAVPDWETGEGS